MPTPDDLNTQLPGKPKAKNRKRKSQREEEDSKNETNLERNENQKVNGIENHVVRPGRYGDNRRSAMKAQASALCLSDHS